MEPDLILFHGKITTLDRGKPEVHALAIADGKVSAIGSDEEINSLPQRHSELWDLFKTVPNQQDCSPA